MTPHDPRRQAPALSFHARPEGSGPAGFPGFAGFAGLAGRVGCAGRPAALLATLGLALAAGCSGEDPAPVDALDSVLLITVDTMRPDYMSMNGYPAPTTPFLDGLLTQGVYFDRAVTPVPRTTPAFASLFAGAYPHTTGVRTLTSTLQPSVRTLAEEYEARGYQTIAIVTNHILDPRRGLTRGFQDYLFSPDPHPAESVTSAALGSLEQLDTTKPLFMWVHYLDPHIPYAPLAKWAEAFDPGYEGPYAESFALRSQLSTAQERGEKIHRGTLPERVNEHIRRLYAATYRGLDDALPPLVERAQELYGDRLLIVFTSDHGESLGEHDFYWDHGDYVYNAGTRVPLGFVFPRGHPLARSARTSVAASLVDLAPTIAELTGLEVSAQMRAQLEGRSLVPAIAGEEEEGPPVFAESGYCYYPELVKRRVRNDVAGRFRAVFLGNWKLIWTPFREEGDAYELYDIASDPHEERNLFDADDPRVHELRELLDAWMRGSFLDEVPSLEGEDLEALKALGYVR